MKRLTLIALLAVLAGCTTGSGNVTDKVLQDFGIRDRPDDYVSGSDRVFSRLADLGRSELTRLNASSRQGEIQFADEGGLRGKYYKQVKIYENYYPLEAQATRRGGNSQRGFVGYVEYSYRIYQSPLKSNRAEASAQTADIPTSERGRETYRYRFTAGGTWNGGKGELVRD